MKVIKTRWRTYHVDPECNGLEKAKNQNWIDKETAEAWGLDPCGKCTRTQNRIGESKWSEFVREQRQS